VNGIPKTITYCSIINNQDIEQQVNFTVKKPNNEVFWIDREVICNSDYIYSSDNVWLAFGLKTSTQAGIKYWYSGTEPAEGELMWIQTGYIQFHVYKYIPFFDLIVFDHGLDGDFCTNDTDWDSPGIEAIWHTWKLYRTDMFITTLVFQPDTPNSIVGPLSNSSMM